MIKKVIFILYILFLSWNTYSQQDPLFNQYLYNPFFLNPAFTGNKDALEAVLFHRSQWVGFKGAPTTETLSLHTPLRSKKVGVGLQLINDHIGTRNTFGVLGSYSYKLLFKDRRLSFGLRAGLFHNRANVDKLTYSQSNDAYLMDYYQNSIRPTFDFGVYYSSRQLFAGFTTTHLNQEHILLSQEYTYFKRHYIALLGYTFPISKEIIFKPSLLLRYSQGVRINGDVNLNLSYHESFDFGISYRTSRGIALMANYKATQRLWVGYSFDVIMNNINMNYRGTSHELFLGYNIDIFKQKTLTPRHL